MNFVTVSLHLHFGTDKYTYLVPIFLLPSALLWSRQNNLVRTTIWLFYVLQFFMPQLIFSDGGLFYLSNLRCGTKRCGMIPFDSKQSKWLTDGKVTAALMCARTPNIVINLRRWHRSVSHLTVCTHIMNFQPKKNCLRGFTWEDCPTPPVIDSFCFILFFYSVPFFFLVSHPWFAYEHWKQSNLKSLNVPFFCSFSLFTSSWELSQNEAAVTVWRPLSSVRECVGKNTKRKKKWSWWRQKPFFPKTSESQHNSTFEEINLYIYLTGWHSRRISPLFSLSFCVFRRMCTMEATLWPLSINAQTSDWRGN